MSVLSPSLASLAQIDSRFEKSLYDLIRGLRSHKGQERAYIQNSIRECRREVRSQDMGMLTFGHDIAQILNSKYYRPQGDGPAEVDLPRDVRP